MIELKPSGRNFKMTNFGISPIPEGLIDGVYFYQRYVDDIIIVISKPKACNVSNILNEVIETAQTIKLMTKAAKTKTFDTFTVGNYNFEY